MTHSVSEDEQRRITHTYRARSDTHYNLVPKAVYFLLLCTFRTIKFVLIDVPFVLLMHIQSTMLVVFGAWVLFIVGGILVLAFQMITEG